MNGICDLQYIRNIVSFLCRKAISSQSVFVSNLHVRKDGAPLFVNFTTSKCDLYAIDVNYAKNGDILISLFKRQSNAAIRKDSLSASLSQPDWDNTLKKTEFLGWKCSKFKHGYYRVCRFYRLDCPCALQRIAIDIVSIVNNFDGI